MWGDYGMGWGWGVFGAIHMIFWWALIVVGIAILVKWLVYSSASNERPGAGRALEILKERHADGEVGEVEFQEKRRSLGK